jgi:hypothetical protein
MSWCTSLYVSSHGTRMRPVIDATFRRNPVFTIAAEVALHLLSWIEERYRTQARFLLQQKSNHTPLVDHKSARKES